MAARKAKPPERTSEAVPKLAEEAQIYVVTSLALWKTPTEILKVLAEDYRTPISPPALWHYDPRNPDCPDRWLKLHAATRKAYVENVANLAGANKAWRVDQLLKLYEGAEKAGNRVLAASLLKQIAEDVGDVYTKTREFTGAGGSPLNPPTIPISAEALLALAARLPRPEDEPKPETPAAPGPEK